MGTIHSRFVDGVRSILEERGLSFEDRRLAVICGWRLPLTGRRFVHCFSDWLAHARAAEPLAKALRGVTVTENAKSTQMGQWTERVCGDVVEPSSLPSAAGAELDGVLIRMMHGAPLSTLATRTLSRWPQPEGVLPRSAAGGKVTTVEGQILALLWAWLLADTESSPTAQDMFHPIIHHGARIGYLRVIWIDPSAGGVSVGPGIEELGAFLRALNQEVGFLRLAGLNEKSQSTRFAAVLEAFCPGVEIGDNGMPDTDMPGMLSSRNVALLKRYRAIVRKLELDLADDEAALEDALLSAKVRMRGEMLGPDHVARRMVNLGSGAGAFSVFYRAEGATRTGFGADEDATMMRLWARCEKRSEYKEWDASTSDVKAASIRAQSPVLIVGGSGTGKERIARGLHRGWHPRSDAPFVGFNCAAITSAFALSSLFGYVDGAYTDAHGASVGLLLRAAGVVLVPPARAARSQSATRHFQQYAGLELRDGMWVPRRCCPGTLFLDEVASLTYEGQGALLRVLDQQGFYPVGWDDPSPVWCSFKIVAATREVPRLLEPALFRQDLRARLDTWVIRTVDAVSGDVPTAMVAAQARLDELNGALGVPAVRFLRFSASAFEYLMECVRARRFDGLEHGNMRGVRAAVERAWSAAVARGDEHEEISAATMAWACSLEHALRLSGDGAVAIEVERRDAASVHASRSGLVQEVLGLVARIFGEQSEAAKRARACSERSGSPERTNGLLEGLLPRGGNHDPARGDEHMRRELLAQLWSRGKPYTRKRVCEMYRRSAKVVNALARECRAKK